MIEFNSAFVIAADAERAARRVADVEFRYARRFRIWERPPRPEVIDRLVRRRRVAIDRAEQFRWCLDRLWTRASTAMPVHPDAMPAAACLSSTLAPRVPGAAAPAWLPRVLRECAALIGGVALLWAGAAAAQAPPQTPLPAPQLAFMIVPTNSVQLGVSTSPASVDLLAAGTPTIWVINEGTAPACVALGGPTVTTTCPGGTNVSPGGILPLGLGGATYLAAATQNGITQLQIIAGHLAPAVYNPFGGSAVFQ